MCFLCEGILFLYYIIPEKCFIYNIIANYVANRIIPAMKTPSVSRMVTIKGQDVNHKYARICRGKREFDLFKLIETSWIQRIAKDWMNSEGNLSCLLKDGGLSQW